MTSEIQFYKLEREEHKYPEWIMSVGIDDKGAVYVPSICHPSGERGAFLCMFYDGIETVFYKDHLFCPIKWVREEIEYELNNATGKVKEEIKKTLASMARMEKEARKAHAMKEGV